MPISNRVDKQNSAFFLTKSISTFLDLHLMLCSIALPVEILLEWLVPWPNIPMGSIKSITHPPWGRNIKRFLLYTIPKSYSRERKIFRATCLTQNSIQIGEDHFCWHFQNPKVTSHLHSADFKRSSNHQKLLNRKNQLWISGFKTSLLRSDRKMNKSLCGNF